MTLPVTASDNCIETGYLPSAHIHKLELTVNLGVYPNLQNVAIDVEELRKNVFMPILKLSKRSFCGGR